MKQHVKKVEPLTPINSGLHCVIWFMVLFNYYLLLFIERTGLTKQTFFIERIFYFIFKLKTLFLRGREML